MEHARTARPEPDRARIAMTVVAPALLIVGSDLVYEPEVVEPGTGAARYDGLSIPALMLPAALGLAVALAGLLLLPRLLAAPRPPAGADPARLVLRPLGWCAIAIVLAPAAAAATGGLVAPAAPGVAVLGLVVGVLALFGLGTLIATVARSPEAAALTGTAVFWILAFTAGTFAYPPLMSDTLQRVAGFTPVGVTIQAVQYGWFGAGLPGAPGPTLLVTVGAAWAVVCWAIALWTGARRGSGLPAAG